MRAQVLKYAGLSIMCWCALPINIVMAYETETDPQVVYVTDQGLGMIQLFTTQASSLPVTIVVLTVFGILLTMAFYIALGMVLMIFFTPRK